MNRGPQPPAHAAHGRQSFGRRHGRPLRPSARAAIDAVLPRISIDLPPPGTHLDVDAIFGAADAAAPRPPLWLEIGFGAGEHLAWQAAHNPGVRLIGAEVFLQGVARLVRKVDEHGLNNLRIFRGDARELLAALPAGTLDRVFILFPDPWPKTRHHKRRIIQRETLDRLAVLMPAGAELRLATDDPGYRAWMLERLNAHPAFEWLARGPADWRRRPDDWPPTRYEAKALAQGRAPVYLRFRRRLNPGETGF